EADVDQRAQVPRDALDRREEVDGLLDRHVEDLGDGLALVVDLERLAVVPGSVAHLAWDVHVGQEVHLDLDGAVTAARLAPTALDVERESPGLIPADLRLLGFGEEIANVVEDTGIRGGVAARCAPDRRLVDM